MRGGGSFDTMVHRRNTGIREELGGMNVYDSAYTLAGAIRESAEYREMESALDAVNLDPESKRMLDHFRARQAGLQEQLMKGEEMSPDEVEKMERLYESIGMNSLIRRVFDAERRIAVLTEDVQRIIAEPLSRLFKDEEV